MSDLAERLRSLDSRHWTSKPNSDVPGMSLEVAEITCLSSQTRAHLALTREGEWAVAAPDRVSLWRTHPVTLLPCLEEGFQDRLASDLRNMNIPLEEVLKHLPMHEVVAIACSGGSEYWASRAVRWLEGQPELSGSDVESLNLVQGAPWASQRTRHRVRRLLKRPSA